MKMNIDELQKHMSPYFVLLRYVGVFIGWLICLIIPFSIKDEGSVWYSFSFLIVCLMYLITSLTLFQMRLNPREWFNLIYWRDIIGYDLILIFSLDGKLESKYHIVPTSISNMYPCEYKDSIVIFCPLGGLRNFLGEIYLQGESQRHIRIMRMLNPMKLQIIDGFGNKLTFSYRDLGIFLSFFLATSFLCTNMSTMSDLVYCLCNRETQNAQKIRMLESNLVTLQESNEQSPKSTAL